MIDLYSHTWPDAIEPRPQEGRAPISQPCRPRTQSGVDRQTANSAMPHG
jgi:hypothetical protein